MIRIGIFNARRSISAKSKNANLIYNSDEESYTFLRLKLRLKEFNISYKDIHNIEIGLTKINNFLTYEPINYSFRINFIINISYLGFKKVAEKKNI